MKKMPTIFNRNYNPCRAFNMQHPDCQWVFDGEGMVTRKWDGTCVKIDGDRYLKRRCVKKGKSTPKDFILEQFQVLAEKQFGWVPVTKEDKWHMEADFEQLPSGTYELVGPKVQGNPEGFYRHTLVGHKYSVVYYGILRTFDGIRDFMKDKDIEGIVFHHPDGRMAKIKKSDYGMERRVNG